MSPVFITHTSDDFLLDAVNGEIPGLSEFRNKFGADIVIVFKWEEDSWPGEAWSIPALSADKAVAVVDLIMANEQNKPSYYVAAHEIGHLMGAVHEPGEEGITQPLCDYGRGYCSNIRTVMATACSINAEYINKYSNGQESGSYTHNTAKLINLYAPHIASFYEKKLLCFDEDDDEICDTAQRFENLWEAFDAACEWDNWNSKWECVYDIKSLIPVSESDNIVDNCPNTPNYFKELYNPYSEIVIGAGNLNNGYWKQMGNLEWVYMWQPDHDLDGSGDVCDEKSGYNKGYTTSKTWVSQPKISIGNKEVAAEIFAVEANRTLSINVWGGFYNPIDTLCFPSPGGYGEVCLPLGGQHRVHYCGLDLKEYCSSGLNLYETECDDPAAGNNWDDLCQTESIDVNNESVNIGRSHATIDTPSFDLGPRWPKISWDYDSKKAALIKYSEVNNHRDSLFANLKQPSAHWSWRADISAQYNCATYYSDYAICDNDSIGAVKKNTPLYYDLSSNYATADGNYLTENLTVNYDYFKNEETRNIEFGGPSLSNYKYSLATRLNSQPSIVQYRKNYISPSELMDSYKYHIENSAFESSASNILIPPVDLIFQEISFVRYQNGSFENNFSGYYPLISSYIPALNSTTQIIEGNRPGVTYSISQTSDNVYDLHVNYAPSSDWRKIGTVLNYGDFDVSDFAAATIYNDTIYMAAEDNNLAASLKYLYRIVRSSGNFVVQQISLLPVSGSSRARLVSSMNNLYLVSDNNGIFSTWKVNPENGITEEITLGLSPVFKTPLNIMGTENGIYLAGKYDPVNPDNTIIAKLSDNNGWQIIHSNVNAETGKLIMNVIDGKLVMTDILSDDPVTTRTVLDMTDDSVIIEEIETPDIYGIEEDPSEYCLNETDDFLKGGLLVNDECTPFTHPWYRSFATGSTIYSVAGKGDRLYVGTNNSIKVYDISDPEAFVLKSTFSTGGRIVYDLEVADDDVMYAATSGGIYKLDTADPDALTSLSFFATSYNYQYRIQLYNDKLYVGDDNGINIRDKETFARLAYVNVDSVPDFAIANGEIALYRSSFWSAGLHIRDVETLNLKAYEYAECYTGELTTDHGGFYLSCDGYEYRFEGRPDTYFNYYPLDGDIREMQENHVYNGWAYIPDGSNVKLSTLNDVPGYCGNGVIEPGELCDGNSVACTTLDPDYVSGTAYCNSTCDGYNESNCSTDGW